MGYKRAEQILPDEIIELIQNYVDGTYIYIPKKENTRRAWGEGTTIRAELLERNEQIYAEYQQGSTKKRLAEKYFLSEKSIQRIIRERKREHEQISA
ncbi:CD3324 family protein [Roseburia sp. 499]|uniref:CD3324 family protein n=1 Tax=Roseburia sp. 499 TaxID=1261634 RepID=UPI000952AA24|nr:CD3324 family protein [Roseburia sp. 499]WVK71041.1 CD3324 family protein [Roseburia sp. 499]